MVCCLGWVNEEIHYLQRCHLLPGLTEQTPKLDTESQLLCHHLWVSSLDPERFPILGHLASPAKEQVCLLFGSTDSPDMVEFDHAQARHVCKQGKTNQDAWSEAQVRIDGTLVSVKPPSDADGQGVR